MALGCGVGDVVGISDGDTVGVEVGTSVGDAEGAAVGDTLGVDDGASVGAVDGATVGDGGTVGDGTVGPIVGAKVHVSHFPGQISANPSVHVSVTRQNSSSRIPLHWKHVPQVPGQKTRFQLMVSAKTSQTVLLSHPGGSATP